MRIIDKYKKLQDDQFVMDMIARSVYGTMQLEEQGVSMAKVKKIVRDAHQQKKEQSKRA